MTSRRPSKKEALKREKRRTILLNDMEAKALDKYFDKYKIENKSKFMRETIMKVVLKRFTDDYPTLWDQPGITVQPRFSF